MKALWPSLTHGLSYSWVQKTAISGKWIALLMQYSISSTEFQQLHKFPFLSLTVPWGYSQCKCVPWKSSLWERNQTVEWNTVWKCSDGIETPFFHIRAVGTANRYGLTSKHKVWTSHGVTYSTDAAYCKTLLYAGSALLYADSALFRESLLPSVAACYQKIKWLKYA